MTDIFISHSSRDNEIAARIRHERPSSLFYEKDNIRAGRLASGGLGGIKLWVREGRSNRWFSCTAAGSTRSRCWEKVD
jgi:hypothetical protein